MKNVWYTARMEPYVLGSILKEYRTRLNLTQEDLCGPEIAVTTIQRIEKGEVIPQKKTLEFIFKRMGMAVPFNMRHITEREYQFFLIQSQLEEAAACGNSDIGPLLERFAAFPIEKDVFTWQFYYLHRGRFEREHCKMYGAACKSLRMGLNQTMENLAPTYSLASKRFVTGQELNCLFELARTEHELGHRKQAEGFFNALLEYLERGYVEKTDMYSLYPQTMRFAAEYCRERGEYELMVRNAKKGMAVCSEADNMKYLQALLELQIEGCRLMQDPEETARAVEALDAILVR